MKKKLICCLFALGMISTLFFSCVGKTFAQKYEVQKDGFRGRTFYEIFVRSFNDANGDGKGDLKGVTEKLDYLSKDLGVKGIWLMPINESPSYHGYDTTDYYNINKDYGTLEDLKELIKKAHEKDIMVIMDLVMNHTSTKHPWFQEAQSSKTSKYREFYSWTEDETKTSETSELGTQPWSPSRDNSFYYSIFWSGMPDLNYDNKAVREEMKNIAKFYLDMGIDGFRLDAAKHIYSETEKNIEWWKEFNSYVKSVNKDAVLVGEVWTDTETISNYMNCLDANFNFPLSELLTKSLSSGSMASASSQIQIAYDTYKMKNSNFIDAPFLSNHDMDRIMNKLNSKDKAKQAAAILMTLPGTPFIYYGEETGMTGAKPDEMIREPFIWDNEDKSKNTDWELSTNKWEEVAVNVQLKDKSSLLNFYKTMLSIRNNNEVLKLGEFEALTTDNDSVMAYKRVFKGKEVYVYINVSGKEASEKTDLKSGKILLSTQRGGKSIKPKGTIELKANEILIIEKK